MAAPIAAPIPRSHAATASMRKDSANIQSNDDGRATPLPQYEKHQSVPFTLALQEEKDNPGQFQLVVNVDPNYKKTAGGTTLKPSLSKRLIANLQEAPREAPSLGYDVSQMYQTQKSSPPSTPSEDRQGWSELDAIPSEFLQKVVPDWNVTFSRSDSTASSQARKLTDIKARIKKSGKGFIVRLLKGSNTDTDEVAEVHLGRNSVTKLPTLSELDSTAAPAELDAGNAPVVIPSVPANIFEIGSSGEGGIERDYDRSAAVSSSIPQWLSQTSNETGLRFSTIEDTFSDAETLLPDFRSVADRMEDHTDIEPASNYTSVLPTRSNSVLSIVKTPTRGLSVVGPVQRIQKGTRVRSKGKGVRPDLNRAGARKSVKGRSPQSSMSESITFERLRRAAAAVLAPDSNPRPTSSSSDDTSDEERSIESNSMQRSVPSTEQNLAKSRSQESSSFLASASGAKPKTRLSLQTDLPKPKSTKTSPVSRRKRSSRTGKSRSSHPTTPISFVEDSKPGALWEEVESDDNREAFEKSFGSIWGENESGAGARRRSIPTIEEPINDEDIGHFALPPGLEIRSAPSSSGNRFAMYCGLAVGAMLDKVVEGIQYVRATYGSEPPVPAKHVRVRWTCSCGEPLYDDFIERRPGTARLLEAYLNRPRAHTPMSPNSRSSTSTSMSSIFDSMSRASTLPTPSSTYSGPSSWGKSNDSSKHGHIRAKSNPFSVAIGQPVEDAWLLTCANEGRFTPKIVHLDVNSSRIRSDKDLAFVLREHYEHLNRRWLKWTRLRGLTTIEFTQFEVHRNRFADIRATPSMPPTSSTSNEKAPSQHPYTFESVDLIPPVGSAYLLHLFKHPEDYDGELITYLRAPKRRERLEFGMGWGINLVEGFHAQKVWAVIMACFAAGSAVFGILWTIKKDDVQGAFGVAGWVVTLAALVLGALQAWLE